MSPRVKQLSLGLRREKVSCIANATAPSAILGKPIHSQYDLTLLFAVKMAAPAPNPTPMIERHAPRAATLTHRGTHMTQVEASVAANIFGCGNVFC